ncbi:Coenzyme F420 hydrogenase/dehydrogenase, beta subunit C-terminal domain [Formosa algae]|uniref:Coenzyme F420 hydrogenase subunit beta n=1 Tax=Formosa algae TaxID=225843 RepID=A0A9X0YK33_9FLAO|nr:Coenzyme F420 hydrogenase/dehydrogenase, beta subunit C-terminal domain [Formosa algae]MBP1838707.1 coenzyme F420 hydrogenase subunit beta [Formosa algae]MDQ0335207.1 coenzyme F420 hydrogenase subunit beta [Formosa algae]OEI81641.1 hypothetical protein AST99_02880 [Formosa algae]
MNLLEEVIDQDVCAGCGLCASISDKIEMKLSKEGFLRPDFLPNSISDDTLEDISKFCPGIIVKHDLNYDVSNVSDNVWGPYFNISSGFATKKDVRYNGSSGGVLTALSVFLLETKEVDCIVHVGAGTKLPYLNETKVSFTTEDVLSNSGSRYAPSSPLEVIKSLLEDNLIFAVVAKPCDISAIRRYLNVKSEFKKNIKYLFSFMCAGVPSIEGTKETIKKLNVDINNVKTLKYRGEGWPGFFKVVDKNSKEYKMSYNESWGGILNKHLQFRCKICIDGTGEFADITCADAWDEAKGGYPSFQEKEGQSLIIERTSKGVELINKAIKGGYIIKNKPFNLRDIDKIQPYQLTRKQNIISRKMALKMLGYNLPNYNLRSLLSLTVNQSPQKIAKNFVGMFLRKLKQKKHD